MLQERDATRRVALVTGGSRGIGAAVCRALARRNHEIVLTYVRNESAAEDVAEECRDLGAASAFAVRADIGDPDTLPGVFAVVDREFGRLDVLVNNAGVLPPSAPVSGMTYDRVVSTLTVNAAGPAAYCAAALQRMTSGAVIVNVSSRAAVRGGAGEFVDYAMSKAAVDALTIGLAGEVAALGIRVVGVRPGLIDTDMNAGQPGRLERLVSTVPLGRVGTAEEVAAVVAFLSSPAAGYVTGVTVDVSGGR